MLFALAPVLPSASASLLLVHVLICANFFVVALFKPWRTLHASYSDILANMIFLIIIFQASFFVSEVDKVASMVLSTAALCAILLGLTGLSFYTMMQLLLSRNSWLARSSKFPLFQPLFAVVDLNQYDITVNALSSASAAASAC